MENSLLVKQAQSAKAASFILGNSSVGLRNAVLMAIANSLDENTDAILKANALDMQNTPQNMLLDRLMLNKERIAEMTGLVREIAELPDVVGDVDSKWERPNGLIIEKRRVPLGLVGMIYEARPNVTSDAAALCLKSGNAVILRGGSEALNSNLEIVRVMKSALKKVGLPPSSIEMVEDTSRETATEMMKLNQYIDVLIPRGGAGLIRSVVNNATIPVLQTGDGICHTYIDESADIQMGLNILINAKCERPSVCNSCETLLVHEARSHDFLPLALQEMKNHGVEIRWGDYDVEFNDLILSVKVVKDVNEAIAHINQYGTRHSECIVTNDEANTQKFMQLVDAAVVYVNASTRFTNGYEFGFGAGIGTSTQKLHARGPMGIHELTTTKYAVYGTGQVRGKAIFEKDQRASLHANLSRSNSEPIDLNSIPPLTS